MWHEVLVFFGVVLSLAQVVPYWFEILRGKAKPNIVSWFTWSLLTVIGSAAAFISGDWQAGWVVGANALGTSSIVVLGLKYGYAKLTRLDVVCQGVALVGLATWPWLRNPFWAVMTAVGVDALAWALTLRHAYYKPHEEAWATYTFAMFGSIFGLLALTHFDIVSSLYLEYLVFADASLVVAILGRRRIVRIQSRDIAAATSKSS